MPKYSVGELVIVQGVDATYTSQIYDATSEDVRDVTYYKYLVNGEYGGQGWVWEVQIVGPA